MATWEYAGPMLLDADLGTHWVPFVIYDSKHARFVAWYGEGDWGVATSTDGIHFMVHASHITSRLGGPTDGNDIFVDDDGTGYIIFSATAQGHQVSIERLTPDYVCVPTLSWWRA